mmetsp:Transcript_19147/g.48649  ORF Transcript_19147/g.48649 Transcript_19147/m.48649 type:complete len:108 (-) Transcript_19147:4841-5164(-)
MKGCSFDHGAGLVAGALPCPPQRLLWFVQTQDQWTVFVETLQHGRRGAVCCQKGATAIGGITSSSGGHSSMAVLQLLGSGCWRAQCPHLCCIFCRTAGASRHHLATS